MPAELLPEQLEAVIKYKLNLMPEAHNTLKEEANIIQATVLLARPELIKHADQSVEAFCVDAITADPDLFIEVHDIYRTEAICTAAGCIWPPSLEAEEASEE